MTIKRRPGDVYIGGISLSEILESHRRWLIDSTAGERAVLSGVDLSSLWLAELNLSHVGMINCNFKGSCFSESNLSFSDMRGSVFSGSSVENAEIYQADLSRCDFKSASLYNSRLKGSILSHAVLDGCYAGNADFSRTDLVRASFRNATLIGCDFFRAFIDNTDFTDAVLDGVSFKEMSLSNAIFNKEEKFPEMSILPAGDIIGWKKCNNGVIVKLLIPAKAKRSNGTGRKCRAEFAQVLEIENGNLAYTHSYGPRTEYNVGQTVYADGWDENRFNECSHGIHFFITKEEAERYEY